MEAHTHGYWAHRWLFEMFVVIYPVQYAVVVLWQLPRIHRLPFSVRILYRCTAIAVYRL